jgi:hypothetical protein
MRPRLPLGHGGGVQLCGHGLEPAAEARFVRQRQARYLSPMEFPVKESIGALVTITVAVLGYLQWKRTKRSGRFIEDREAAYKAVWQALEEIHLYVRGGTFDQDTFDDLMRKANTLLIQQGLHISEPDKHRTSEYIQALARFGAVVAQMDPGAPAKHEIAVTAEGVAMPSEYRGAYDTYQAARNATIEGFRRAIGAGQI